MNLKSTLFMGLLAGVILTCPFAKADDLYGAVPVDNLNPVPVQADSFDTLPPVQNKISPSTAKTTPSVMSNGKTNYQTEKLKNAVTNIDGAQIDLRTQIATYKKQLNEIDNRFKAVKDERKAAKAKIKGAENRLKQMEAAKKQIDQNINN